MENIHNERKQREDIEGYTPDPQVTRFRAVAKVKVTYYLKVTYYRLRESLQQHSQQTHPNLYGSVGSVFTAVVLAA